jgi:hypothetical protein
MNDAAQQEFDWLLGTQRPLLRVSEAARVLHDCSERHVIDQVDEGTLRAYNLASEGTDADRRLLRLDRASVLHRALGIRTPYMPVPVAHWLPVQRPSVHAVELARWFGVARNTVVEWNLAGPASDGRSVFFTKAVIEFLESREVQALKV